MGLDECPLLSRETVEATDGLLVREISRGGGREGGG